MVCNDMNSCSDITWMLWCYNLKWDEFSTCYDKENCDEENKKTIIDLKYKYFYTHVCEFHYIYIETTF